MAKRTVSVVLDDEVISMVDTLVRTAPAWPLQQKTVIVGDNRDYKKVQAWKEQCKVAAELNTRSKVLGMLITKGLDAMSLKSKPKNKPAGPKDSSSVVGEEK